MPIASSRSPTPKFFSAEPKNTGLRWPSRKAWRSKRLAGVAHQIELARRSRRRPDSGLSAGDLIDAHLAQRAGLAGVALEQADAAARDLDGGDEVAAAADRPVHRRGVERERLLDLIEQLERVAALAVHLVDEGEDRDVAQPADFEQLAGARLDALRRIDHHDGGIDRGQRPIGVLGEILVARRVEQIEHAAVVLEGHHRGDDRDAALALDRHPVGLGGAAVALGLDVAGELDRAAEQQQLLGQRGLAGVRMRDDREGAAALDLGRPAASGCGRHPARGSGRSWPPMYRVAVPIQVGAFALPAKIYDASVPCFGRA